MNRFEKIFGDSSKSFEVPYFSELIVKKPKDIENIIAKKIGTVHVLCALDDNIKKFLEKVKPDFIKIKEGKLDDNISNGTKIVYNVEREEIKF